jgi:succinyl-CoA synthetase alpha subunit
MSILISKDTSFIVQGITGREAVNLTRENLDYGAKIVGGVTPGRAGRDVYGVPVYDCVRDVVAEKGAVDGAIVSVPPRFVKDAVFEALENGIRLLVIVTENVPRREVAQMVELAGLRGARIIGPNCLGIISPGEAKMGGIGGPAANTRQAYTPGPIGIMSRSGGMTTEIASTLTAAGLGQSTAVSIGGDAIIGSGYAELMPLYEADPATRAVAIYSEPGGRMEAELAEWIRDNDSRLPVVAFMAGRFMDEMQGMRFGHAGTRHHRREDRPHGGRRDLGGRAHRGDSRADPQAARVSGELETERRARAAGSLERTQEMAGLFIDVEVDASVASDRQVAAKLAEVCPVGIFESGDAGLRIVEENLDECVLCDLCLTAAPDGAVRIVKLYE